MKWKSRDHVSPQECSADKAGLLPNYTNFEKKNRGQVGFCAHTKLCSVVQLVSCNCLAGKVKSLGCVCGAKCDQYMNSAFLRSMFLSDISKIHSYISANFVGDISPLQRLACQ